jgi:MFS family permease
MGLVSLFTDIASEMIVPVRSIFLANVLLTPMPIVGVIEGIAESTASILKVVSGRLADSVPRRKPLLVFGYGLSSIVKPLLAFVVTWQAALAVLFADRVGKGVRSSPRDALLADSTERKHMGKAFGFHRAMDTTGAAIGPLITALIIAMGGDLRTVFAWTALPGLIALVVLVLFLRERVGRTVEVAAAATSDDGARSKVALGPRFWMFTAIATVFALGNTSDAFLFLRVAGLGEELVGVALVYFAFNIVYAMLATPMGALSDRWGRLPVLIAGYAAFALVYSGWAVATQSWNAWLLFIVYGVYTAATEGVARAFVTDLVPRERRGTALGWFTGLTGFAALPANLLGGWLWSAVGPQATFQLGAFTAILAVALLAAWMPWLRRGYAR